MPNIKLATTNFKIEFPRSEIELQNKFRHLWIEAGGNWEGIDYNRPKKLPNWYSIPPTLDNALLIKKIFKKRLNYNVDRKYKDFVLKLYYAEKDFSSLIELSNGLKSLDPTTIGSVDDKGFSIDGHYFKTTPWEHQKIGFKFITSLKRVHLNWDMRTGKTYVVSNSMEYFNEQTKYKTSLVIAPAGILESTWIRDVYKHTELQGIALTNKAIKGRIKDIERELISVPMPDGSFKLFPGKPDFYVVNHDCIRNQKFLECILDKVQPDNFIIDEYHLIKNPNAKRTKAANVIGEYVNEKDGMVVCMSGTPIAKDIRDIYAPTVITNKNVFPYPFGEYKKRFCVFLGDFNYKNKDDKIEIYKGEKNVDELKKRYGAVSYRVLIQDVHDMPERVNTIETVDMSSEQQKIHDELYEFMLTELPESKDELSATNLTKLIKLVQVTGGYLYNQDKKVEKLKDNPKLDQLEILTKQILSNPKNNLVIWTNYIPSLKLIRDMLKKNKLKFSELSTRSSEDRNMSEYKFQTMKDRRIILAQPALAPGKDFSKANYSIFFDNTYKFTDRSQAERRIYTPQSLKHGTVITIDLMMKDSVDELIYESIKSKETLNEEITAEKIRKFYKRLKRK